MSESDLNEFVLANMPYFIAVNYQRLLAAETSQERVELALHTYNLGLRALTIGLVSQYLIRDRERVCDPYLNELLLRKFPRLTLDTWQQLFFASLRAYEGKRELFFMPELYDFYWDTSTLPHKRRTEVEQPFDRLTQIAMEIQTERLLPQDEAGWEQLAEETMDLLRQILRNVAFVGQYDLIRVLDYDEQSYDFELHKGLKISTERQPLPKHTELSRGWFYLREGVEDFLLLHPLLVFWEEEPGGSDLTPTDTGVYDRFVYERLQYLLATLGKTIVDDKSVKAFVTLLYDTIEEAKRKRQEAERLIWWQLHDICADITRQRMATVRHKYRSELYLQRDKTRQAFENFLVSDKRCFVLIGKSGVGKSNFLLALGEELHRSRSDVSVLMYDGVHLNVEPSVTRVVSQDFDNRLILAGRRVQDVWREIAQVDGMEERLVVLCVDAINENPQAKELLKQLDELVQGPWPWLKVVFSSRPETWQVIKRGVRLAEALYYREEGTESLGVELEPFSYSEQMVPFSRQELPEAYAKYQQAFDLQTWYEALPVELREMLREPLNLWLVAKTYEGQAIPDTLKVTKLVEQYIGALLRSERLGEEDLQLLEKQLVPLMVGEGHYSNAITIADIDAVGGGLYEVIYSEQVLSDGRRTNQSFINLLDADILVRQEEGREQNIAFKYERFFDHYAGARVYEIASRQEDIPAWYEKQIEFISTHPYLWGAVKNAIELGLSSDNLKLVRTLAQKEEIHIRDILIAALVDWGIENQEINAILTSLILKDGKSKKEFNRPLLSKIVGASTVEKNREMELRTAIQVAGRLEMCDLLQVTACHMNSTIRAITAQELFYIWRSSPKSTLATLEHLVGQIKDRWGFPNPDIIESCIGISLPILFDGYQDTETSQGLKTTWKHIINSTIVLARTNRNNLGLLNLAREWAMDTILSFVVNYISRTTNEIPNNNFNLQEIGMFIRKSNEEKKTVFILSEFLDPANDISKIRDILIELVNSRDTFTQLVVTVILINQATARREVVLEIIEEMFERAKLISPAVPLMMGVIYSLMSIIYAQPSLEEALVEKFGDYIKYFLEHHKSTYSSELREYTYLLIDPYLILCYRTYGHLETPTARYILGEACQKLEPEFVAEHCVRAAVVGSVELKHPLIGLKIIEAIMQRKEDAVIEGYVTGLARIRTYYPELVDEFLDKTDVTDTIKQRIYHLSFPEQIGDVLLYRAQLFAANILRDSPLTRTLTIESIQYATQCHSVSDLARFFFRKVVNHIQTS